MGQACVQDVCSRGSMSLLLNSRMLELRRQAVSCPGSGQDRPPIRRCLFGPVNHQQNLKFAEDEMDKISKEDEARWNFNFKEMKSFEGKFAWEAVDEEDATAQCQQPELSCHASQAATCFTTPHPTNNPTPINSNSLQIAKSVKRLQSKISPKVSKKITDYFSEVRVIHAERSKVQLKSDNYVSTITDLLKLRSPTTTQ